MGKGKIILGIGAAVAMSTAVVAQPVYQDSKDSTFEDIALALSIAMSAATLGVVASDHRNGGDTIIVSPGASAD